MLKRYRHRDIALGLVGLITAALLGVGVFLLLDYERQGAKNVAEKAAAQERITTSQIADSCLSLESFKRKICVGEALAAQHEAERTEKDLNAQQGMAKVAFWMFILSGIQAIVGIGGIWFVARTLDTNAEAVDLTRKALITENRPWIKLGVSAAGPFTVTDDGCIANAKVHFKNIGHSPARRVIVESGWVDFFADDLFAQIDAFAAKTLADYATVGKRGESMFPDDVKVGTIALKVNAARIENGPVHTTGRRAISTTFVLTATYQSQISDDLFQTVFVANLRRIDDEGRPKTISLPTSNIPEERIMFDEYPATQKAT